MPESRTSRSRGAAAAREIAAAVGPRVRRSSSGPTLPADVTGGTLSLEIGNEFHVEASTDGSSWQTVLHEDREIRDQSNYGSRDLDLNELRDGGRTLYLRFSDSFTSDGWGAWLGRTKLVLQR